MKKNSKSIACACSQIVHRSWITLFLLFVSFFCFAQADNWQQMQQLLPKKIIRQSAFSFNIGSKGYVGWAYTPDFWEYDPVTDIWTQKSDVGGAGRGDIGRGEIAFSIGNKGYVFSYQYFWEYDPATNAWKQKADFGGTAREDAVGFSIGNKGYIGTGTDTGDFWEYDPATDTWTRKADLAGGARFNATGFSIGSKGYIGLGRNADQGNYLAKNDFWEYNPATNAWNQKANFGGSARYGAASFSIGTKGYIGTGTDLGGNTGDFWEYGPATDTWTRKADFIGEPAAFAIGLSIDGKGYLGLGHTMSFGEFITYIDEYDPAADAWIYKTGLGGGGRVSATGFSIGTKGYIGLGNNNDFWEYNSTDNTWTQKANFEGVGRYGATGFSIGTKGYIGLGNKNDFWEYNPASNIWLKKADFEGGARSFAVGFSIGNKGYVGTGNNLNYGEVGAKKDFWEYDPATNTWTQKADFGGTARYLAIGFRIGSKGYVGTGSSYRKTEYLSDFWEYDPINNTWTQKAAFGGGVRSRAVGFSIGKKGYIGTGDTLVDDPYINIFRKDFWEYDPAIDVWTKKTDFGGFGRYSATGFSIGSYGYLGFGLEFNSWNQRLGAKDICSQCPIELNDWWKYTPTPDNANSITTTIASTTFCTGSPVDVNFVPGGSVNENSFFTAQLSDPKGDFAKSVSIGKQSGFGTGIIKAIIPFNTIPGNTYRIRVVSNNPTFAGSNNGANITINQGPVLTSAITATAICNNTVFAYTPAAIPAGTLFSWSRPVVAGIANTAANSTAENTAGVISEKLINTRTAPVNVAYNYLLNNNGCNNIAYKVMVTVKPSPLVITKNITVYLNANGAVTITPNQVDNGSVSYCGSISYALDKMSFNCSNTGANKVKLTVKDCIGNASTANAWVTVKDNIPPVISDASANPAILWPPNHSMRNVTVNYTVKDNCCVASTAIIVKSNEPSVNNESDWIIVDKHHLQLRADRAGNGSGRVYTITISAKDVSGNSSTKVVTVAVPHNQNSAKSEATIVGFDAADNGLSVQAMPNPSQHYFTLITKSNSNAPIAVSVTDAAGKLVEVRNNVTVKSKLELGNGYRPGTYYVQVIQGNNKATVTLVKQGN